MKNFKWAFIVALLAFSSNAHAFNLYAQLNEASTSAPVLSSNIATTTFTGISANPGNLTFSVNNTSYPTQYLTAVIIDNTAGTLNYCAGDGSGLWYEVQPAAGQSYVTFDCSHATTTTAAVGTELFILNPTHTYSMRVDSNYGINFTYKGLNMTSYVAPYAILTANSQAAIISYSPPYYTSTTSPATVTVTYSVDSVIYTGVAINLTNVDTLQTYNTTFDCTGYCTDTYVIDGADGTYVGSISLSSTEQIVAPVISQNLYFTIGTSSLNVQGQYFENSTTTLTNIRNAFDFVGIIAGKFPFNWFFDTVLLLKSLVGQTSTTTIPSVVIDYSSLHMLQNIPTTTAQNLTFTFFSGSTFDTVAAIPGIQAMRTLAGYVLWIGFMFMAYRRIAGYFGDKDQVRADSWRGHQLN